MHHILVSLINLGGVLGLVFVDSRTGAWWLLATRLNAASVRLFIHSETGSRIFAGCQLLTSRRVDDWETGSRIFAGCQLLTSRPCVLV